MFKFLKRQFRTKTGKYTLGIVGGFILDGIAMKTMGVGLNQVPMAGMILDKIISPEIASVMMGFSLLRDQKAKEEHE